MRRIVVAWMLAFAVGGAGCGSTPTAATASADTAITSPQSITYGGVVGPGGAASRSFTARLRGTASATVSGIGPPSPLVIGLGVPRTDGSGCLLARSSEATAGDSAWVTASVDVGTFCVQVYAPATAPTVTFTVTLVHP